MERFDAFAPDRSARFGLPRRAVRCYGRRMFALPVPPRRLDHYPSGRSGAGGRRDLLRRVLLGSAAVAVIGTAGCGSLLRRADAGNESLQSLLAAPKPPETIGQGTRPIGLQPLMVVGVGAVNNLPATGGPPDPSSVRDQLIEEMKRHDVPNCEKFLELDSTALVSVEAAIPPGARRGDTIDIRVVCPDDARATDLAGGWLLDSRLHQELRVRGGSMSGPSLRKGDCLTIATGPVTTLHAFENSSDPVDRTRGRVIGGGQVQQDRELGLAIRKPFVHAKTCSAMADAISDRFFYFDGSSRKGIATATTESRIDLDIPPRYRHSVERLIAVIEQIPTSPRVRQSQDRLRQLAAEMEAPSKAMGAALRLEALGEMAIPVLLENLKSENPEIRFYAAESLAYLDRFESVEPLVQSIIDQPAMRAPAFHAMRDLDDPRVDDVIAKLLGSDSIETRYAAFVTMRRRGNLPGVVKTTRLGSYTLHQVRGGHQTSDGGSSDRKEAVIASMHDDRELVIFGEGIPLHIETFLRDRRGIVIKPVGDDKVSIERFAIGNPDRRVQVTATVAGLIGGLAKVGLSYGEIMTILQTAKVDSHYDCGFAIDPLPKSNRTYYRVD